MKWISVKDRLPELYVSVLVCNVNALCQDEREPFIGALDANGWFQPWINIKVRCIVTHWQLLPEPPKESTMKYRIHFYIILALSYLFMFTIVLIVGLGI